MEPIITWSNQLEDLIASEGEKCRGLSWIHRKAEIIYNTKNNYIAIPVIVLSTLAGTASVGSSSLFPDDTKVGSIVIGLVSISVGILNTINSYFSYSRKAEAHRIASISYSKLFNQISVELSLPRIERVTPNELLQSLRDNMERLSETTPTPPQSILDDFNNRFKNEDKDISRPVETNGLQKIKIFREIDEKQSHTSSETGIRTGRIGSERIQDESGISSKESNSYSESQSTSRPSNQSPTENIVLELVS